MSQKKKLSLLIICLAILMAAGCGSKYQENKDIVAKIGDDYTVTPGQLGKYVKDWLYIERYRKIPVAFNKGLQDMLTNQMKRMDFFAKGLDKDTNLIESISRTINEELVNEYYNTQYLDKYVNEKRAKEIYGIMDKRVFYQLITLNKPENASKEQIDSIKNEAMMIKAQIDSGKDFTALVNKYSQDKVSLNNKGFMPPVDWKQSLSSIEDNVIFQLDQNDVRILNSNDAFRIVRIDKVDKVPLEPFDKMKDQIISDLKNGYEQESYDQYENDKKNLIDENSLKWNDKALKQILKWSNIPKFYTGLYKEVFKKAISEGNNPVVLNYNKGSVDYREYLRLLNHILVLPSQKDNLDEADIKSFILEAVRTNLIVKKADALDLKKKIFNPYTNDDVLKNQIVYLYNQAEIEAKIPDTTEEALHQFYQKNQNTLFYQLQKVNIFVINFPDKEQAEKALEKIHNGIPFEKITGSYFVKTYIKERNGEIKSYLENEPATFGEVAFKMKQSEVTGPIEFKDKNNQNEYAIIKCFHIRPEKQLTFDDVKNYITKDYKDYYRNIISKEVENKLKEKYHPEINEDVLGKFISEEETVYNNVN